MEETPIQLPITKKWASRDTILSQRSRLSLFLVPFAFVAGLALGYLFWGQSSGVFHLGESTPLALQNTPGKVTQIPVRFNVPVGDNPYVGPENAPITLIEFGDYQCSYCRAWFLNTYPQLMTAYQGKIRFVYRDFPLSSIHANASPAAEAADCAGEQGKYYPFHDKLFNGGLSLGSDTYLKYASDLGLDVTKFKGCIDTNKYQAAVEANYEFAYTMGITSTPTFFINGLALVGAQSFAVFKQVIDQELAGQIPK